MKDENLNNNQQPIQDTPTPEAMPSIDSLNSNVDIQPISNDTLNAPSVETQSLNDAPVLNTTTNNVEQLESTITATSENVGFVATGQEYVVKKSKKGLIIGIVIAVIVVIALVIIFANNLIAKLVVSPKKVFDTTITTISKNMNNEIQVFIHDKVNYNFDVEVDSNINAIDSFSGYKYGGKFGIDTKNKTLELGYFINNKLGDKFSKYTYVKDDNIYERYSTHPSLLSTGVIANNEQLNELFINTNKQFNNLNAESTEYLIDKFSSIFKNSIDANKLSKEEAAVVVNNEVFKTLKHKYVMDKDNKERTRVYFANEIRSDERLVEILSVIYDIDKKELKDKLQDIIDGDSVKEYDDDAVLELSIYTLGISGKFIGFEVRDYNEKVETKVQYFTLNDNFEIFYYNGVNEVGTLTENIYRVKGIKSGNVTNIEVNKIVDDNPNKQLTLVVKKTDSGKSIDYVLYAGAVGEEQNKNITGNVEYSIDTKNDKTIYNVKVSVICDKEYLKLNMNFTNDWTTEISNINVNAVQTPSEGDLSIIETNFESILSTETPADNIDDLFDTLLSMIGIEE